MAMATNTVPAFIAAVGIYLFDRRDSRAFKGMFPVSLGAIMAKPNEGLKTSQLPKLAPQFDGLHSFETFVAH